MSTEGGKSLLPNRYGVIRGAIGEVVDLVRGAAFWLAALLPLSYLPLLQAASLSFAGFTKLLVLNVVAVVVGHSYGNDGDESDRNGTD